MTNPRVFRFFSIVAMSLGVASCGGGARNAGPLPLENAATSHNLVPAAKAQYTVVDLGFLPGFTDARVTAINDAGMVIGQSAGHCWLWNGSLTDLNPKANNCTAAAINSQGIVVGNLDPAPVPGGIRGFIYNRSLKLAGPSNVTLAAINDVGFAIGQGTNFRESFYDYKTGNSGSFGPTPPPGEQLGVGRLDNNYETVLSAQSSKGAFQAHLYHLRFGPEQGIPHFATGNCVVPGLLIGPNNLNQIVYKESVSTGCALAVYDITHKTVTRLPTPPKSTNRFQNDVSVFSFSNGGVLLGTTFNTTTDVVTSLWQWSPKSGYTDIRSQLPSLGLQCAESGGQLNAHGQIACSVFDSKTSTSHPYLLNPPA